MYKVPKQSIRRSSNWLRSADQGRPGFAVVARELGMSEQALHNWVKAEQAGKLNGAGAKPFTAEQMEPSRMRAEIKRLQT